MNCMDSKIKLKLTGLAAAVIFLLVFIPVTGVHAQTNQSKLEDITKQKKKVSESLDTLEKRIVVQEKTIKTKKKAIRQTTGKIQTAEQNLVQTKKKMKSRENNLKKRVKAMYKSGSVGYLDVVLSSQSATDLVTNTSYISRIYRSDQNAINELKDRQEKLSKQEAALKRAKDDLKKQMVQLKTEKKEFEKTKAELQRQYKELSKEEEKIRKEEEMLLKLMAENGSYGGLDLTELAKRYKGGKFFWPANSKRVNSGFGPRSGPGSHYHKGLDIHGSTGDPIYAGADGIVTLARWYSGYGNCVKIGHGSKLTTLYGHCSKILVKQGQKVRRGQKIALIGNTGNSFGSHLHFGVLVNGTFVNPVKYLKQ